MTPVIFKMLKLALLRPEQLRQVRFARFGLFTAVSYAAAVATRDAVYWPIVVKVYSEVNRIDT